MKNRKNTTFPVTPDIIRGDFSMDVYTDLNAPTMNEIEKAQKLEFFSTIPNVVAAINSSPDIAKSFPLDKVIRDLAEDFGIDMMESKPDVQSTQKVDEAINKLKQMQGL